MSVFKVQLNNTQQGNLDVTSVGGAQMNPSIQRSVYIMGPGKVNRLLKDGDTFTDCNYYKRFCYPNVPLDQAILTVLTDDGSIYSDVSDENTFLKVYNLTIDNGTTYTATDNIADILGDTGGYAVFTQITNNGSGAVSVRINGSTNSTFTLAATETQIFNAGELAVSKVAFANSSGSNQDVQVMVSVRSECRS